MANMIVPSFPSLFRISLQVARSDCEFVPKKHAAFVALHAQARRTSRGRPYIDEVSALSVSYAEGWRAYLTATRKYVGVDLEVWAREDLTGLDKRLGPVVTRGDIVQVGFLTSWVLKEACLKAVGLGLLPALYDVKIQAEHLPSASMPGARLFTLSFRKTEMTAMVFDLGHCLLGFAYKASYGPPQLDLAVE